MAILYDGQVKMANLAIVAGYSVNGVAALHTEILEKKLLQPKQLKFRKMRDYIFQWGQLADKQYFGVQA